MDGKILIGWDGSEQSRDALEFGRRLAEATGRKLVVTNVYPWEPFAHGVPPGPFEERLIADAEVALAGARAALTPEDADFVPVPGSSPAQGLHAVAEREHADLVLVGSCHRGGIGRAVAGSTAQSLLHGAPCPVGVAPRGYRFTSRDPIARIGVAYNGTPEATEALRLGRALARRLHGAVRVIDIISHVTLGYGYGYGEYLVSLRKAVREGARALEEGAAGEGLTTDVREGDPAAELITASTDLDLLVLGSRGYGPVRRVLLGATSARVLQHAACPVLVVPRGVHDASLAR